MTTDTCRYKASEMSHTELDSDFSLVSLHGLYKVNQATELQYVDAVQFSCLRRTVQCEQTDSSLREVYKASSLQLNSLGYWSICGQTNSRTKSQHTNATEKRH